MTTRTIDDQDPSMIIQYSGQWAHGGTPLFDYRNTTTYTTSSGSYALFSFNDNVDIKVWGTIAGDMIPLKVSFQIDNQEPTVYTPPKMTNKTQFRQQLYAGTNFSSGPHTLNMTSLLDAARTNSQGATDVVSSDWGSFSL
ncbi:hypothetical protein CPC08DRAFT_367916 [Agrocybe pediades]|nr:hypothetical protein CPC08DRAFT_367916 [Agrocybe pediades]